MNAKELINSMLENDIEEASPKFKIPGGVSKEAQRAFNELLNTKFIRGRIDRALGDIYDMMSDISQNRWPDNHMQYAIMRYKPLEMTDDEFIQEINDIYINWDNSVVNSYK